MIPPPKYTFWDRITPGGRRRKQMAYMENGFRQVLGLLQSMRENQQVLFKAFQQLPDAVASVKKLADHSAQQAELLQILTEQMSGGGGAPLGKFNETLVSMDKTTQLLLERAQRSEERLYGMLRRAQRHIALMTAVLALIFLGGAVYVIHPEATSAWLRRLAGAGPESHEVQPSPEPANIVQTPPGAVLSPEAQTTVPAQEATVEPSPGLPPSLPEELRPRDLPPVAPPTEPQATMLQPVAESDSDAVVSSQPMPDATSSQATPDSGIQTESFPGAETP